MLRAFLCVMIAAVCSPAVVAQFKIDFQACEDLKITETHYGITTVETATCLRPSKTFSPKGDLANVNIVATFPKVPTGAGVTFQVRKGSADGENYGDFDYAVSPNHTTAYHRLTINTPGHYFVQMVNFYNKSQVWATTDFTIGEDKINARATGNTVAGGGKVSICKSVDDNGNCVGGSGEWAAYHGFSVLFRNPDPVGVDFIGIIIYKQSPDGKDIEFYNEFQQHMGTKNRWYGTGEGEIELPAGTYSIYIISWDKREVQEHNGNLKDDVAKTTLVVKKPRDVGRGSRSRLRSRLSQR
ncbi:MAG: hypothetical protein JO314_01610 [Acidobacteria bacterium]|nr:hypothetical protein [Acidobacteriota bacterium]